MDTNKKEKSVVEKTVDVVKEFAATVSEAAHRAVEQKPAKSEDEIIMMPAASTDFTDDAVAEPVFVRKQKKARKTRAKTTEKAARKTARKNIKEAEARRNPVAGKTKRKKKTKKSSR